MWVIIWSYMLLWLFTKRIISYPNDRNSQVTNQRIWCNSAGKNGYLILGGHHDGGKYGGD